MDQLSERLMNAVVVGVTIRLTSTFWRVELHHVDVNGLRSIVIGVLAAGVEYELRLVECVVLALACLNSPCVVTSVTIDGPLKVAKALVSVAHPGTPVVTRVVGLPLGCYKQSKNASWSRSRVLRPTACWST